MSADAFHEEHSGLLTPSAFAFVLDSELRRALRSLSFLTLVVLETARQAAPDEAVADDSSAQEVARLIHREVRDTDLVGHTDIGTLSLVLIDANLEHATRVVNRLIARIKHYEFSTALRIAVGAACYPTNAIDAESLTRQALSHPIVTWRGGGRRSADHN